jgi:hypothetical protein
MGLGSTKNPSCKIQEGVEQSLDSICLTACGGKSKSRAEEVVSALALPTPLQPPLQ